MADPDWDDINELWAETVSNTETDWVNIRDLWADMVKFAKDHPDHVFLSADDSPRIGWNTFREDGQGPANRWTITLANIKKSLHHMDDAASFKTAAGRQRLCAQLTGKQTLCNP